MTIREKLDTCREVAREVRNLALLIESVAYPGCGCRSPQLTGMPRGGNDATAAAMQRLETYNGWYIRQRAELSMLAEEVETIIGGLETWAKVLMRAYYIEAKTDTEVAFLMGWSFRQTAQNKRAEIISTLESND